MRTLKYFLIGAIGAPAIALSVIWLGEAAIYAAANYNWWPGPNVWIIAGGSIFGGGFMIMISTLFDGPS